MLDEVEGRRPRRAHDPIGADRRAHRREAGHVVRPVVHRVVGDVHDVVARGDPLGEEGRDAGDGIDAPVEDTVEVDEEEHGPGC